MVGHLARLVDDLSEPSHSVVPGKGYHETDTLFAKSRNAPVTCPTSPSLEVADKSGVFPRTDSNSPDSRSPDAGGNIVLRHFGKPARIGSVPCAPPSDPHPRGTGSPSGVAGVDYSEDKTLSGRSRLRVTSLLEDLKAACRGPALHPRSLAS